MTSAFGVPYRSSKAVTLMGVRELAARSPLSDQVKKRVKDVMDLIEVLAQTEQGELDTARSTGRAPIWDEFEERRSGLIAFIEAGEDAGTLELLIQIMVGLGLAMSDAYPSNLQLSDRARQILQDMSDIEAEMRVEQRHLLREASLADARASAQLFRDVTGDAGESRLARFFFEYSSEEKRAADRFRGATIAAVIVTIASAGALQVEALASGEISWTTIATRALFVAGVGGLATYLGRQAGNHRRIYNWAKSVQVQLQSFPALIQPVQDRELSADMYRVFTARVLGAPPEPGSEPPMTQGALLDLFANLARRMPNS